MTADGDATPREILRRLQELEYGTRPDVAKKVAEITLVVVKGRVTLHSFRHLNASMLINAGMDVKTVQAAMGHAHATTTMNIYAHQFQTAQARACDAVSNALNLSFSA